MDVIARPPPGSTATLDGHHEVGTRPSGVSAGGDACVSTVHALTALAPARVAYRRLLVASYARVEGSSPGSDDATSTGTGVTAPVVRSTSVIASAMSLATAIHRASRNAIPCGFL